MIIIIIIIITLYYINVRLTSQKYANIFFILNDIKTCIIYCATLLPMQQTKLIFGVKRPYVFIPKKKVYKGTYCSLIDFDLMRRLRLLILITSAVY